MAERHPDCVFPLCDCAGTANCKANPLNTPLPCDVKVGATTFRKGVKLGTFVTAAQHWHRKAFPEFYTLTDEQKAANLAALQGNTGVQGPATPQDQAIYQGMADRHFRDRAAGVKTCEPCPRGDDKPEPSCTNRAQCWEPCGELGNSAAPASGEPTRKT